MPNVSIGENLEAFIEAQVKEGRFQNASEVVRAGLRLLQEHELELAERMARLKAGIDAAFDEAGESVPLDLAFDAVERRHAARAKSAKRGA